VVVFEALYYLGVEDLDEETEESFGKFVWDA